MKTGYDMPMLWLSKEKATMQKGQKRTAALGQRPDLVLAAPFCSNGRLACCGLPFRWLLRALRSPIDCDHPSDVIICGPPE